MRPDLCKLLTVSFYALATMLEFINLNIWFVFVQNQQFSHQTNKFATNIFLHKMLCRPYLENSTGIEISTFWRTKVGGGGQGCRVQNGPLNWDSTAFKAFTRYPIKSFKCMFPSSLQIHSLQLLCTCMYIQGYSMDPVNSWNIVNMCVPVWGTLW